MLRLRSRLAAAAVLLQTSDAACNCCARGSAVSRSGGTNWRCRCPAVWCSRSRRYRALRPTARRAPATAARNLPRRLCLRSFCPNPQPHISPVHAYSDGVCATRLRLDSTAPRTATATPRERCAATCIRHHRATAFALPGGTYRHAVRDFTKGYCSLLHAGLRRTPFRYARIARAVHGNSQER